MVETIATYWEKQIKVYGISNQSDLRLVRIVCPDNKISIWGTHIEKLEPYCRRFEMVSIQPAGSNMNLINLVIKNEGAEEITTTLEDIISNESQTYFSVLTSVALVYFHGPHFQERFGITHALSRALEPLGITVLLCGCSGTSVYIVIPEQEHDKTVSIVTETFLVPGI